MNILNEIGFRHINSLETLEAMEDKHCTVWTQDGPSDDTMLVCEELGVGIYWDSLFGYSTFPLGLQHLESCGWVCVGEL